MARRNRKAQVAPKDFSETVTIGTDFQAESQSVKLAINQRPLTLMSLTPVHRSF